MAKQRNHNEYFRTVSLGKRKSCPTCRAKIGQGESIWSWGQYVRGKWETVEHFCRECFPRFVRGRLLDHTHSCGCTVTLVGYGCQKLPVWLSLDWSRMLVAAIEFANTPGYQEIDHAE